MFFGLVLTLVVIYNMINIAIQNKFSPLFKNDNEERIHHELKSQGFFISYILLQGSKHTSNLWTRVHLNMPKNISNFIVKYINNTLATKKNLRKWSLSTTSACSFCFQSETIQDTFSSCKSYLQDGRYTWRHNSVLLPIAKYPLIYHELLIIRRPSYLSISIFSNW